MDDEFNSNIGSVSSDEQLNQKFANLHQENVSLKAEIETLKLKVKSLQEDNLELRKNSVNIQVRAEQEEEYISNKLLKKITELKKEKESLALNYEQEEEFLTNDLTRKLSQLRDEKANLEKTLEKEQEAQISKLMNHIQKLENEVMLKQKSLDTLRREKIELENSLEQEGLVNKLWKKLEKLEAEKRMLQSKLDLSPSPAFSDAPKYNEDIGSHSFLSTNPNNENDVDLSENHSQSNQCSEQEIDTVLSSMEVESDHASLVHSYIGRLRQEVSKLRDMFRDTNLKCSDKLQSLEREERVLQDENKRLRKRLQAEIERRQEICRNLSESESSLEIDEERSKSEDCRSTRCNEFNQSLELVDILTDLDTVNVDGEDIFEFNDSFDTMPADSMQYSVTLSNGTEKVSIMRKQYKLIREGDFGEVFLAKVQVMNPPGFNYEEPVEFLALKITRSECKNELKIYRRMQDDHPNIVKLRFYRFCDNGMDLELIMEYLPYDLREYLLSIKENEEWTKDIERKRNEKIRKIFMKQILSGLEYLQEMDIIHLDIKSQSVLVDPPNCIAKIADFGSAVLASSGVRNIKVDPRYYCSPEMLCRNQGYTISVDIWAAACVFMEMINGEPVFQAANEKDQLKTIFNILGYPTPELKLIMNYSPDQSDEEREASLSLSTILKVDRNSDIYDLLMEMLNYDFANRITAKNARNHKFFAKNYPK